MSCKPRTKRQILIIESKNVGEKASDFDNGICAASYLLHGTATYVDGTPALRYVAAPGRLALRDAAFQVVGGGGNKTSTFVLT